MYRIDDPTASTTLPTPEAALTEGYWTEGNPGTGVPATLERASWFNMLQEELRAIVVAGGLTPSKTTYNQVLLALKGRYLGTQAITATGTYTPGTYNGVTAKTARVRGCGAGGGSAGAPATGSGVISLGTPGATGNYAEFVTPAIVTAVIVGAAGAAGAAGGSGGSGGTSSWGALVTLPGGVGGTAYGPVAPPYAATTGPSGAPSGTLTPLVTVLSNPSYPSQASGSNIIGAGAAPCPLGSPGGPTQSGAGQAGSGYGAGASGASNGASLAARPGGPGTQGVWIVDEFA